MADDITPLTDAQIDALLETWQNGGEKRLRNFGANFSEEDYIAGAMSVFFALECQDKIPAGWAFFGLSDNSYFRKKKYQKNARLRTIRLMEHGMDAVRMLQRLVEMEQDLTFEGTRADIKGEVLATIRKIMPDYTLPEPEEEEDE